MGKHLQLTIEEEGFDWQRKSAGIEREASLDGIYVIRTSVPASQLTSPEVVATYKSLSTVERAFRSMKSMDLKVRPIYHHQGPTRKGFHPEIVRRNANLFSRRSLFQLSKCRLPRTRQAL